MTNTTGEINPKNRHCLRGLEGKYGRWDEILRDILNGKLKIVQNKKRAESETDDDDEDEDDEETPEEIGTPIAYDTSEKDGRYVPIRTNPEEDTLQLHTDSEMPGTMWNRHKDTPKPETIQKPADFLPEEESKPGPSDQM